MTEACFTSAAGEASLEDFKCTSSSGPGSTKGTCSTFDKASTPVTASAYVEECAADVADFERLGSAVVTETSRIPPTIGNTGAATNELNSQKRVVTSFNNCGDAKGSFIDRLRLGIFNWIETGFNNEAEKREGRTMGEGETKGVFGESSVSFAAADLSGTLLDTMHVRLIAVISLTT
jgi:hypothetical protein